MTISRITGAACAAVAALVVSMSAPAAAQASKSLAMPLTSAAQAAPKAKAATVSRARKAPNRMPTWNTYTMGNADLAFLSAGQYLELSAHDDVIAIVAENEFNLLDFSAGTVRVVDPDELSEIDLANDPDVLLAQRPAPLDSPPLQDIATAAATTPAGDADDDDGILNRILMTFAGALAMASALRMIIA